TNEDRFQIDTFLLSCRAFGKGVEHQILWELARIAEHEGKTSIDISLIHTHRNQPAFDFINAIAWKHQHVEADCTLFKMPVRELRTLRYEPADPALRNQARVEPFNRKGSEDSQTLSMNLQTAADELSDI